MADRKYEVQMFFFLSPWTGVRKIFRIKSLFKHTDHRATLSARCWVQNNSKHDLLRNREHSKHKGTNLTGLLLFFLSVKHKCIFILCIMYILTCNMVGWKKKCGFLCTTKYEKLRVWHHSDWLNHINHFCFFCICLSPYLYLSVSLHSSSLSSSSALKGVRPDVDGESEGGAGLVVALVAEQRVHWHHLQVQRVLSGPRHGAGQHQHGTDIIDLLEKMKQNMTEHIYTAEGEHQTWHRCFHRKE